MIVPGRVSMGQLMRIRAKQKLSSNLGVSVLILFTIVMNLPLEAYAEERFFKEKARGWHWYESKEMQKKKEGPITQPQA